MMNPMRPMKPRDEDRQELQAELTRLVGAGRLQFAEFDELMDTIWSTEDKTVLDRIRARYLGHPGTVPGPVQQQPPLQYPQPGVPYGQPMPMAQPGASNAPILPNDQSGRPVTSNMGTIRRAGQWTAPEYSAFKLTGATLHLDLREAHAAAPVITFDISATFSSVDIIVPPGVYVENQMKESWSSSDIQVTAPAPGAPRVILTGVARGSEVKIRTLHVAQRGSMWRKIFGQG